MSKSIQKKLVLITVALIVVVSVMVIGYLNSFSEMRKDAKKVSCDKLSTAKEVRKVLAEHNDTLMQIERFSPGNIWINVDYVRCPGKADILIYYSTVDDRDNIKKLIGDTFFGVPYRMFNV